MKFCALASGSSGNCIYVGHEDTHLLVDAGISGKRIEEGLRTAHVEPSSISAILITHDHSDHTQGAAVFSKKYGVPIYATAGTLEYIVKTARCAPEQQLCRTVRADEELTIGSISVRPFAISHDAIDPVSYCLKAGGKKLGMATDLGKYDSYIIDSLSGSDALYIESNHDVNMLMLGSYPYCLKVRIASDKGHLSNEACGELVRQLRTERLKNVVLAHLSKDNNFGELAYETVRLALEDDDRFDFLPELIVAKRSEPTGMITL